MSAILGGLRRTKSPRPSRFIPESLEGRQLFSAAAAPLAPVVTYNANGLNSISYNGSTLYNASQQSGMGVNVDAAIISNGTTTELSSDYASSHSNTFNTATHQLIYTFAWGTVTTTFTQVDNRLNLTTQVNDTSSTITVRGITLMMPIQFPTQPIGFTPSSPQISLGTTGPAVTLANYSTGSMAVVNDDGTTLMTGLFSFNDFGPLHQSDLTISSMPISYEPGSWAKNYRSVAPGSSDTYHVSLRFGAVGATARELAPDAYATVIAANPDTVSTWSDRRIIGELTPADSHPANTTGTNPNGWFDDPNIDVTTPQGLANFRTRLLNYADNAVAELKSINAQGAITWDIEGEHYRSADYVGDPRLATILAPELAYDDAIDAYFKKFTDAGLRVGVTVRPTDFQLVNGAASQVAVADEAALLINKINYARQRWGATLFYIDSFEPGYEDVQQHVLQRVAAAEPGVLLIPEHASTTDFASGAPYFQINQGFVGTPNSATDVYPDAFSVLNTSGTSTSFFTPELVSELTTAVEHGDILMVLGHVDFPVNRIVASIYTAAAAAKAGAGGSQPVVDTGNGTSTTVSDPTPVTGTTLTQTGTPVLPPVLPVVSTAPVTTPPATPVSVSSHPITHKKPKRPLAPKKHGGVKAVPVTHKQPVQTSNHFSLSSLNWRLVSDLAWTQVWT